MIFTGSQAKGKHAPEFTAGFDSATAMVTSLGKFLKGKDFPGVGVLPSVEWVGKTLNMLPDSWKEMLYSYSGWYDGVAPARMSSINLGDLDKWVTQVYPKRKYPAIAIGSANGALVHLYAALGIPWLPQTFLVPVKKSTRLHPDEPKKTIEWAKKPAYQLLSNNPDIELHHMMDPSHDRLHLYTMTYFRVKKLRLGEWYENFIRDHLMPGGTLFIIDCQHMWPVVRIDDRYVFQFGGAGGNKPEKYYYDNQEITQFLKKYQSPFSSWDIPKPDEESPEAEWGYAPALTQDIERFATENSFKIQRVSFEDPHDPSPLIADLYREWYQQRKIITNQLLIECFALHEPYWALRTGSVPFWLVFNIEPSAEFMERYLQNTAPYDDIYLMLLSHGTDSIRLAPIDRWNSILAYARNKSSFVGMDTEKFPRDFGVYMSYNRALQKAIPSRYPLLNRMPFSFLYQFLEKHQHQYDVDWSAITRTSQAADALG